MDQNSTGNSHNPKKKRFHSWLQKVKKLNGYLTTKKLRRKHLVKVRSLSSTTVCYMYDHVKPTSRDFNPEHVIFHIGGNILNSEKIFVR